MNFAKGSWTQVLVLGATAIAPSIAFAQGTPLSTAQPWVVTLTPTLNPLPVGVCGAVQFTVFDVATRDVPRNRLGARVTIADFDMEVTTAGGTGAAGQWIDATHFSACGCQGGVAGTVATVTATYPARALAAASQVLGVAFQRTATFALGNRAGTVNPPGCLTASALASSSGAVTVATAPAAATSSAAAAAIMSPTASVAPTDAVSAPRVSVPLTTGPASGRLELPPQLEGTTINETFLFSRAGAWQVTGACISNTVQMFLQNSAGGTLDVAGSVSYISSPRTGPPTQADPNGTFQSLPAGGKINLLTSGRWGAASAVFQIGSGSGARSQSSTVFVSAGALRPAGLALGSYPCAFQWGMLPN